LIPKAPNVVKAIGEIRCDFRSRVPTISLNAYCYEV